MWAFAFAAGLPMALPYVERGSSGPGQVRGRMSASLHDHVGIQPIDIEIWKAQSNTTIQIALGNLQIAVKRL